MAGNNRKFGAMMLRSFDHQPLVTRLSALFSQMHKRAITAAAFQTLEGDAQQLRHKYGSSEFVRMP